MLLQHFIITLEMYFQIALIFIVITHLLRAELDLLCLKKASMLYQTFSSKNSCICTNDVMTYWTINNSIIMQT